MNVVVGVTGGAVIALLLIAVGVLGVGVLVVWRRSRPALQSAIAVNGNVDNPVYGGRYSVGTFHWTIILWFLM